MRRRALQPARAPSTAAETPQPTEDTAVGLAGPVCLGADAWRVASLETWREQDVRVWRAVEPIADAIGPLDPAIPTVPVVAIAVEALGWCAPGYGPERPVGPVLVEGWIVIDGVASELELRQVVPAGGTTPLAALYQPIARCALGESCTPQQTRRVPQRWVAGRVVFRYEDRGAAAAVWFGADVELYAPAGRPPRRPQRLAARLIAAPDQRSRGSWSISYVARARMTRPIPASHSPGTWVMISTGSLNWSWLWPARSMTR